MQLEIKADRPTPGDGMSVGLLCSTVQSLGTVEVTNHKFIASTNFGHIHESAEYQDLTRLCDDEWARHSEKIRQGGQQHQLQMQQAFSLEEMSLLITASAAMLGPILALVGVWISGRLGGRLRIKVDEFEIEASNLRQVEKAIELIKRHKGLLDPNEQLQAQEQTEQTSPEPTPPA